MSRLLTCGCPAPYKASFGHTCIVHDANGRRWDSYTGEEIAKDDGLTIHTADGETYCGCARHTGTDMPAGTLCVEIISGGEEPEADVKCLDSYRQEWINVQTIDWIAAARDDGQQVTDE